MLLENKLWKQRFLTQLRLIKLCFMLYRNGKTELKISRWIFNLHNDLQVYRLKSNVWFKQMVHYWSLKVSGIPYMKNNRRIKDSQIHDTQKNKYKVQSHLLAQSRKRSPSTNLLAVILSIYLFLSLDSPKR